MEELEEINPWQTNLNKVTCNLREGLDISKLSTTGADFELIPNDDPYIEDEKEAEHYQQNLMENLNPECADFCDEEGDKNSDDDDMSPFAKMAVGMEDLTGDGGILKKVLTHGIGPVVPEGALVRVHYNGYLEYCDEPYDSSRLRNKEQQFKLGRGNVLLGWEVGVATMKRKELARYLIGPSYAFGKFGCPPRIPPNATIMFEIEIVTFVDLKVADDFGHYTKEERENISLDKLVSVANAIREEGNDAFHYKSYGKACAKYMKAVRLLENRRLKNDAEEAKWKSILVKLYLNVSLCNLRLRKPKVAILHSRNALSLDCKSVKAIFRLGQAHMQLSEFEQSRHYLLKAGKLSPGNVEIRQELEKLNRAVEKFKTVEKNMCIKMFPSAQEEGERSDSMMFPSAQEEGERSDSMESKGSASLPKNKLEEYRQLYHDKFSQLCQNPNMMELTVPLPLPESERTCAEGVAKELDLLTEMVPDSGLRVYKMPIPEMEEFLENH